MKDESMQALIDEITFTIDEDIPKRNLKASMQTTLFPDENYQGILDEKSQKEFIDRYRFTRDKYIDLLNSEFNNTKLIEELKKLMDEDPDYLYPYLKLVKILKEEDQIHEADKVLENAYIRALNLIIDESDRWPGKMEGCWLPNWHILRTILEKAISLWETGETDDALNLFRKLLKTNPNDEFGVRNYILGIRMNLGYHDFQKWVGNDENHEAVLDWFEENYSLFPDEFGQWRKEAEQQHQSIIGD